MEEHVIADAPINKDLENHWLLESRSDRGRARGIYPSTLHTFLRLESRSGAGAAGEGSKGSTEPQSSHALLFVSSHVSRLLEPSIAVRVVQNPISNMKCFNSYVVYGQKPLKAGDKPTEPATT